NFYGLQEVVGYAGCMYLQTSSGGFTFVFAAGGFTSGVATTAAILQINDESATRSSVSGKLRIQDAGAFRAAGTTALHANYAFGEHGGDSSGRFARAGSFVLDPGSGEVASLTADQNAAGASSSIAAAGTVSAVSAMDGRAILSLAPQG